MIQAARIRRRLVARSTRLATLALVVPLAALAQAGETWDGNGGDNDWTTNNNWNPNGDPPNDGTADIVMAGTNRLTPRVDVDWDIFSLVFNNTAGAFSISGAPGVTLRIANGGITNQDTQTQTLTAPIGLNNSQTWSASAGQLNIGSSIAGHPFITLPLTLTGANSIRISGAITSGVAVNKTGSGTLTFNGFNTNTYTGATTVSAGTLALARLGGLNRAIPSNLIIGDGSGSDVVQLDSSDQISEAAGNTVTVNSSGLLNLNGFDETLQNLTLNGGSVSGAGALTVSGAITTGASTSSVISSVLGETLTIGGAGTLMLSGSASNILTGPATINGGTLLLNKSGGARALSSAIPQLLVTIGDGVGLDVVRLMADGQIADHHSLAINSSGVLDLNGFNQTLLEVSVEGGSIITGGGVLSITSPGDLHILPSAQTATFSGNLGFVNHVRIADGAAADDFLFDGVVNSLNKFGNGRMRLLGTSIGASVVEGELVLAGTLPNTGIGGNGVLIGSDGLLVLAADEKITAAASSQVILRGTLDLAGFNETINDLSIESNGTVNTGGGTLIARNLTLRSAALNPADGLVTINGTVTSIAALAVAPVSLVTGNVNFTAPNLLVNVGDGVIVTDLEIALPLGGDTLTKTGAGTLLFSGPANTYVGATTVNGGVLALGKSAADGAVLGNMTVNNATVRLVASEQISPAGAVTLNSSTFDLNGFTETIGNLTLNGAAVTTGAGTLVVTGNITQSASAASSISGRLDLSGATRTIVGDDSAAAIDLNIPAEVINGGIVKQGAGTWRMGGNSTFAGGIHHQTGKLLIAHDNALGIGVLLLGGGTTIEADGGARNISNSVVVASLSTVSGSNPLTLGGAFTTNLGAALFKNGVGALTIAGPQAHASGATLFATAGAVNFDSSATGAALSVNLSNAGTLVNFNADQDLNTLVVNGARVRAGDATQLRASGLSIDANAVLELEIGGLMAGNEFAQLLVSGNALLAGTLEITLTNGFSPQAGDSFDILDWGSLSGSFAALNLPGLTGGLAWNASQLYTTGVLSVAPAFTADFDEDGDVDSDDLLQWRGDFGQNALSDADNDGDSDGDDFLAWQRQLGGGVLAIGVAAAVPEPGAARLAAFALGALLAAARRRAGIDSLRSRE